MSLIFYYAPMSSATPVHWTLEELAVPYEKVRIDLKASEQKSAAFLKLNPNGKVPLLVHDGVPIFESVAIQIHLGETFGVARGLFPAPGLDRAEAIQWLVWCNVSLGEALSRYHRNTSDRVPVDQRNAKAAEIAKAEVENHLRILDNALRTKTFLVAETFSLADLHLASWMEYVGMYGFAVAGHGHLQDWVKTCTARPARARAAD